jgi:Ca-activated chloride channel family protein
MMKLLLQRIASLETIAKATKGGYNGNNTKEVLAYVKSSLDNIQKTNLSRRKLPIFNHSFNGF